VDSAAGAVSLWDVQLKQPKKSANSDRHAKDIKDVFYKEVSKTPLLSANQEAELVKNIQRREYWVWFQLLGRQEALKRLGEEGFSLPGAFNLTEELSAYARKRNKDKYYENRSQLSHELRRTDICLSLAHKIFNILGVKESWPKAEVEACFEEARMLREQFVKANLRLVGSVAQKFDHRRLSFLDKIQEGSQGLLIGLQSFDLDRGFRFSTYAHWWIRQSIERGIQNQGATIRIPVHVHDHCRAFKKSLARLSVHLGREPSLKELKDDLGLSLKKITQLRQGVPVAMIAPHETKSEYWENMGNATTNDVTGEPETCLVEGNNKTRIMKGLRSLKPIEREVLIRRFGLYGDDEETLETIGNAVRLTRERIRQIQLEALRKIRAVFEENAWSFNL
jgi:RNA polymerase sigma factor (sigma-70 family)